MRILLIQPYKVRNFLLFCAEIQSFIIPPSQKAAGEWKFATLLLTKKFFSSTGSGNIFKTSFFRNTSERPLLQVSWIMTMR